VKRFRPSDPRLSALRRFAFSITAFTIVGHFVLGLETSWAQPAVALVTAYVLDLGLEALDAWGNRRRPRFLGGIGDLVTFLLPAHISALSIGLLIYPSDRLWPFAFASAVAVGAKFLFRAPVEGRPRHFMNPSNLGIALTLVLFPWVGIAPPYHFTEQFGTPLDWIVPIAVLVSGLLLNLQLTQKGPLIAAWIAGFVAQALVRGAFTGVATLAALSPITGAAFILFTNYMITDPGTTPVRPRGQAIFGLAVAAVYGLFMAEHVVFGIFFALVIVCFARGCAMWAVALRAQWLPERRAQPVDARKGALEGAPTT
jgi:enediyne biosynthesis protein E5